MQKIPKIIHYCWFGNNQKTKLVKKCIASWKKYLPDYEIREWNDKDLENCDNVYVKEAYSLKKYAFVSDYFRLYALYNYGGIYFDTDNEVFKTFDEFLDLDFFSGCENNCNGEYFPFTAVVGAKKGNHIIKDLLDEYKELHFINSDGSLNMYTNTRRVTDYFQRVYNFCPPYNGKVPYTLENMCVIYPYNIFCTYEKGISYAVHHFNYSWKDEDEKLNFLQQIFSVRNVYSRYLKRKIITILGIKIKYIDYKKSLKNADIKIDTLTTQLEWLKRHTDITQLKPATGELRKQQLKLVDLCQEFFNIIKVTNIKPFIDAGNLLGKIRHNGFIPWDDDIDFGLIREDYDNLINFCKDNINVEIYNGSIYEYNEKEFKKYLCRKYPNEFVLTLWHDQIQIFKGSDINNFNYIDFFPYDYYDDNYSFYKHKEYLNYIKKKKFEIKNNQQIIRYLQHERITNQNIKNLSKHVYFGIDNMGSYNKLDLNSNFMPYDIIFPLKKTEFEGLNCYMPNKPLEFLNYEFKDFMSYPKDLGIEKHNAYLKNNN